ncbi:MAG: S-layer homology domain-containing protein [Oscillospiraceae bacterium]|nr:S-layer homology domain-containing protein [Oscillospiraceae bacterium]
MKKTGLSVLLCICMVVSLLSCTVGAADWREHWAAPDIQEAVDAGWLEEYAAADIQPDAALTRAEFATLLWHALGAQEPDGVCPFTDVAPDAQYRKAVTVLAAQAIVTGYDAHLFCLDAEVTREQGVTMLARAYTLTTTDGSAYQAFQDGAAVSGWARDAVSAMMEYGYLEGSQEADGAVLHPAAPITLGEAVALLVRVSDGTMDASESDFTGIANAAYEGDGTEDAPYLVRNTQEMWYVGRGEENPEPYRSWTLEAHYRLTTDGIVLENWLPIGDNRTDTHLVYQGDPGTEPEELKEENRTAYRFKGSFDGDGHTVTIDSLDVLVSSPLELGEDMGDSYNYYIGLFGYVADTGVVENLTVAGTLKAEERHFASHTVFEACGGAIAGYTDGEIRNCGATAQVTIVTPDAKSDLAAVAALAGGLVGNTYYQSKIVNCYATGDVTAYAAFGACAGGLIGRNLGTIKNSYALGNAASSSKNFAVAGGFAGDISSGEVVCCYAAGSASAVGEWQSCAGGFSGELYSTGGFSRCVALGASVSGGEGNTGRVVGEFSTSASGRSEQCYAAEDMVLLADNKSFTPADADKGADTKQGVDVSRAQVQGENWWKGATGPEWADVWGTSSEAPWQMGTGTNQLPVLYWQTAAAQDQ